MTSLTDDAMALSALLRRFWIPLEVSRNCDAKSSSALTALACRDALLEVPDNDEIADSNEAMAFASDVPEPSDPLELEPYRATSWVR